ncbi:unnamed protein product, partial [Didymodactylos carnosus]
RPVAFRASTIGIWFNILTMLAHIAIIANAFLIAFTSEFLPRLLYMYTVEWSMKDYTKFTLADAPSGTSEISCKYRDFRDSNGNLTVFYWKLLALRLFFVILFEHVVFGMCRIIDMLIPDVPKSLEIKIRHERYLAKRALQDSNNFSQIIAEYEDERSKSTSRTARSSRRDRKNSNKNNIKTV